MYHFLEGYLRVSYYVYIFWLTLITTIVVRLLKIATMFCIASVQF